jgi:hypothetical protein
MIFGAQVTCAVSLRDVAVLAPGIDHLSRPVLDAIHIETAVPTLLRSPVVRGWPG